MRLVLAGAVIVLIAAACGGGGSPTSTVAQDGNGGSEATAVAPTPTLAQGGNGGFELAVAGYAAWCGKFNGLSDPATWGEATQQMAEIRDDIEDVTLPEELEAYHSALLALLKATYDFSRSQGANESYDQEALNRELVTTDKIGALADEWDDWVAALGALDDATLSQLQDAGCFG